MGITTVICPKCGEQNADTFRFCGMCGAALGSGKTATRASSQAPETPRPGEIPVALRIAANPSRGPAFDLRPTSSSAKTQISGPSLLGLGPIPQSGPTVDTLREKAFSGSTPTFVYEDAKPPRGRTLLLVVILAVLAVGVWMRYRYLAYSDSAKPQTASTPDTSTSAPKDQTQSKAGNDASNAAPQQNAPSTPTPDSAQPAPAQPTPAKPTSDKPGDNVAASTNNSAKDVMAAPATEDQKPATPPKQIAKAEVPTKSVKPAAAAKPAADTGSSTFLKGEAYLYGRGVPENCDEAIKNLKSASSSGNAKARSTFGTMYATGHCVPRDLPTSYSWFAKALEADPNNQVLEKDLTAIWNQMTPPEKQLATKLKQ